MGCCGCSLYASAIAAAIYTLLHCLSYITWTSLIIANIYLNNNTYLVPEENVTTTASPKGLPEDKEIAKTEPVDVKAVQDGLNKLFGNIGQRAEVLPLCITALVLSIIWLMTAISLIVANKKGNSSGMRPWVLMTVLMLIASISASGYFLFISFNKIKDIGQNFKKLYSIPEVVLASLFSTGGPIAWIIFIALIIYVNQRIREIKVYGRKREPENRKTDIELTPVKRKGPSAYDESRHREPPADYGGYDEDIREKPPRGYNDRDRYDQYDDRDGRPIRGRGAPRDYRHQEPRPYDQPDRGERMRPPPHSYVRDDRPEPRSRQSYGYDNRMVEPDYEDDPRGFYQQHDRGEYARNPPRDEMRRYPPRDEMSRYHPRDETRRYSQPFTYTNPAMDNRY